MSAAKSLVQIDISNDGDAVPANIAPRIFVPYVSGRGGGDNMGLGLAIVKKIVMEHNGEIERPYDISLLARFFAHRMCEKNNIKDKAIDDEVLSEIIAVEDCAADRHAGSTLRKFRDLCILFD